MTGKLIPTLLLLPLSALPSAAQAVHMESLTLDAATQWVGHLCLGLFGVALFLVILEEFTQLRKSKPVLITAGAIWGLIAWAASQNGSSQAAEQAVRHNLLQYTELMLLMLVVMTYINAMSERRIFTALRGWMGRQGYNFQQIFWLTGLGCFFLSPLLDNLSTAMLGGAIILAVGGGNPRFVTLACINIVIAANAGGAFSPFGDITTLMVWQQTIDTPQGIVDFWSFFHLFLPCLVSFLIPATALYLALPKGRVDSNERPVSMRRGARRIMLLFLCSIATAVSFRSLLHLPAAIGMLTGLAYLQFFGYFLKKTHHPSEEGPTDEEWMGGPVPLNNEGAFDIFTRITRVEWDTLLFIYGIMLSVGGLGYLGYLALTSDLLYNHWGPTIANISIGLFSSLLENIPMMYAVLTMMPEMSKGQWLLVTLTTGIGGSILSIGSATGLVLMGQARGQYTFFSHLRWTPVILLGYAGGIFIHLMLNETLLG